MKYVIVYTQIDFEETNGMPEPDVGVYNQCLFDTKEEAEHFIQTKALDDFAECAEQCEEVLDFYDDKQGRYYFDLRTGDPDDDYVTNQTIMKVEEVA